MHYTYKGLICIPLIGDARFHFPAQPPMKMKMSQSSIKAWKKTKKKAKEDLMNFNHYPFLQELNFRKQTKQQIIFRMT